ncbi:MULTISPECIES: HK97 family phage prohead protease [Vibrio]|uniref:HK97 family phage prohead protease n=1 Tax=Vibrio TaxID=662 RepID=UPI002074E5C5|nr:MULTISPECIES: HK97 family phage prohead protease [Vibrio]USD32045.1 HK97 family phage prohead protease [Vibrio sp. SCSIO 43186]USD45086.1 HK97 family phage prohead protease [Vibrio sp. SCSIO 43145]USD69168.1 HK97 family phage prohead protease [Vibrio sp. SCSIO 43139]USD96859.1 HK97 family phage prohead protease [Vibrio coralliilyticus]
MKRKQLEFEVKSISETGAIEGYLNTFNELDAANDITMPGAFKNSLARIGREGRKLPMLLHHKQDVPIGVWEELREDSKGLWGRGQVNLNVQAGREAYELAKQGALTGISIGYFEIDVKPNARTGANHLNEADLREASLVTFPANDSSRVDSVKDRKEHEAFINTMKEINEILWS